MATLRIAGMLDRLHQSDVFSTRQALMRLVRALVLVYLGVSTGILLLAGPASAARGLDHQYDVPLSILLLALLCLHLLHASERETYTLLDGAVDAGILCVATLITGTPALGTPAYYMAAIVVASLLAPPSIAGFSGLLLGSNLLAAVGIHLINDGPSLMVMGEMSRQMWIALTVNVIGLPGIMVLIHGLTGLLQQHRADTDVIQRTRGDADALQERLSEAERMATLGRMTASIAHEMNNDLCAILNALEIVDQQLAGMRRGLEAGNLAPAEQLRCLAGTERWAKLGWQTTQHTVDLMRVLRSQTRRLEDASCGAFSVTDCLKDVAQLMHHECLMHGCQLIQTLPAHPIQLNGEAGKLVQVVMNLVKNAVQSYPDIVRERACPITVSLEEQGQAVSISVTDAGCGIAPDLHARIFERSYTTKPLGQGTGYGLAIVKEIVEEHFGGHIEVVSQVGQGTTFRVVLPKG